LENAVMRFRREAPIHVAEWLDIATCGLDAGAVAAVSGEVLEHYHEAREAAVAAGAHPVEADLCALQALGDPRTARREFLRVHLTEYEILMLSKQSCYRGLGGYWICLFVMVVCTVAVLYYERYAGAAFHWSMCYAILSSRWHSERVLRSSWWLLPHLLCLMLYLSLLLLAFRNGEQFFAWWGMIFFPGIIAQHAHLRWRLMVTRKQGTPG